MLHFIWNGVTSIQDAIPVGRMDPCSVLNAVAAARAAGGMYEVPDGRGGRVDLAAVEGLQVVSIETLRRMVDGHG